MDDLNNMDKIKHAIDHNTLYNVHIISYRSDIIWIIII